MKKTAKLFRELLIDTQKIRFKKIKLIRIIEQLPAGNDVLECLVYYKKRYQRVIIKLERSLMADFKSEIEVIKFLRNKYNKLPNIIEYGQYNDKIYIIYKKEQGKKLSQIFRSNEKEKEKLLAMLGKELAVIHSLDKPKKISKKRIINYIPKKENYEFNDDVLKYISWLKENQIDYVDDTFIHGDFHYGNVLFDDDEINKVIDYEYSGLGFKEQDIAWALVLRPGQTFFDNLEDISCFLEGYLSYSKYDFQKLNWCYINACVHFYLMNSNGKYKDKLMFLMDNFNKLK